MVPLRDIAYHAGNYYYNEHSIGIEIEGYALQGNTYYTQEVYKSVAALVAYLADRYDIPLNRRHIVGHDQVPGPNLTYQAGMHWDPGPFFNWNRLLKLAGANKPPSRGTPEKGDAVVIRPKYRSNEPPVSSCETDAGTTNCTDLPEQPASFVYLHTGHSDSSPYISDTFLSGTSAEPDGVGTTQADDWGTRRSTDRSSSSRRSRATGPRSGTAHRRPGSTTPTARTRHRGAPATSRSATRRIRSPSGAPPTRRSCRT